MNIEHIEKKEIRKKKRRKICRFVIRGVKKKRKRDKKNEGGRG
jgi:hypothetical protein